MATRDDLEDLSTDVYVTGECVRIVFSSTRGGQKLFGLRCGRNAARRLARRVEEAADRLWEQQVAGKTGEP